MYDVLKALGVYGSDDLIRDHIVLGRDIDSSFNPKEHYHKNNKKDFQAGNGQPTVLYLNYGIRKK